MEMPKRNSFAQRDGGGDESDVNEYNKLQNPNNGDHGGGVGMSTQPINTGLSRTQYLQQRWDSAKKFFSDNGHTVTVTLLALVVLLFLAVMILSLLILTGSVTVYPMKCESVPCMRAAITTIKKMDLGNDFCDDFWSFSCGGWIKHTEIPPEQAFHDVKSSIRHSTNLKIHHILHSKPQKGDATMVVKGLYDACMNIDSIEHDSDTFVRDYITARLGGWTPLARSRNKLGFNKLLEELNVEFGVHPFFKITVETDDYDSTAPTFKVMPAELVLPSKYHYNDGNNFREILFEYETYISNLLREFGVRPSDSTSLAQSIIGLEKRIADGWDDSVNASIPWTKVQISELQDKIRSVEWLNLIGKYSSNPVRRESKVTLVNEKYFENLAKVITTIPEDVLTDYMIWRFVEKYVVYLSDKYRSLHVKFRRVLYGIGANKEKEDIERWEFCIETVKNIYGLAVTSLLSDSQSNDPDLDRKINALERLVEKIKEKIQRSIGNLRWATDAQTVTNLRDKIAAVKIHFGDLKFHPDVKEVNLYYKSAVLDSRLIAAVNNGYKFISTKLSEKMQNFKPDFEWPFLPFEPEIRYEYAGNKLYIGLGLLESPFFEEQFPNALNYGSFVFNLISEMFKAIDQMGIYYGREGLSLPNEEPYFTLLTTKSLEALNTSTGCLLNDIRRFNSSSLSEFNTDLILPSIMRDVDALTIAFDAYRDFVLETGEEHPLPGLALNSEQLFFVSFAQSMCEMVRPGYQRIMNEALSVLPAKKRVEVTLKVVPQFSKSFSCHFSPRGKCYHI